MFRDTTLDLIDFQIASGDGRSWKWSSTHACILSTFSFVDPRGFTRLHVLMYLSRSVCDSVENFAPVGILFWGK